MAPNLESLQNRLPGAIASKSVSSVPDRDPNGPGLPAVTGRLISTTDFSSLLDDSIDLADTVAPSEVPSTKFNSSSRELAKGASEALTSPYRSAAPKWLSGGSISAGSITRGETSPVVFAIRASSSLESLKEAPVAHQKTGTYDNGPVNRDDHGQSEATPQLSSPISIVSALAAGTAQNVADPQASSAPTSPSTGGVQYGTPAITVGEAVAPQIIGGDAANNIYPAKSDLDTTAFAIALTPAEGMANRSFERHPELAAPPVLASSGQLQGSTVGKAVLASSGQLQGLTVGKAIVQEQSDDAFADTSIIDASESELHPDRSTGNALPGSYISPAGSQNNPRLRSTEMSSQSGAAMDATKLHPESVVRVGPESAAAAMSGPTNYSSSSSSNPTQPIESHEMHAPGAQKTDLTVRIQGDAGQSVNLRVVERAGQIQVSVRTNDPVTAAMLRREMPALQTGLERIGWHANPITHAIQQPNEARSSEEQSHSRHQNPQQNSDSNPERQQQRPRSGAADQWLELMYREN